MAYKGRVAVVAPAPSLSVTIERSTTGADEIHVHAGGQGYWIARLAAELGADVTICGTVGGEAGAVVRHLLEHEPMALEIVATQAATGMVVHDRRRAPATRIADMAPGLLDRHGVDDLFGAALAAAADAGLLVLPGVVPSKVLPAGFHERLTADARSVGATVVADVSGPQLGEVVRGGVDVLKVSADELRAAGLIVDDDHPDVLGAARGLCDAGAGAVVVSRAAAGSVVVDGDIVAEVAAPRVDPVEPAGAGDSMTGALAAVLARGEPLLTAVRVGTAAAALNVTRRGLGSGRRADIERFAATVEVHPLHGG